MAKKKPTASDEQLKGDVKYNNKLISKFINCLIWKGKKSIAQKAFYEAIDLASQKVKDVGPLELFEKAVNNVKPLIEVRSKRIG